MALLRLTPRLFHHLFGLVAQGVHFFLGVGFDFLHALGQISLRWDFHLAHVQQGFLAEMLRHDFGGNARYISADPNNLIALLLDPDRPVLTLEALRA